MHLLNHGALTAQYRVNTAGNYSKMSRSMNNTRKSTTRQFQPTIRAGGTCEKWEYIGKCGGMCQIAHMGLARVHISLLSILS